MRSPINLREAPSRVQRVISLRMSGMKDTSWVGTKSAPRSCPNLVPDYGEVPTLARLNGGVPGRVGNRFGWAKQPSHGSSTRKSYSRADAIREEARANILATLAMPVRAAQERVGATTRVRGLDRVALHPDLTILATLACALALARARAVPLATSQ